MHIRITTPLAADFDLVCRHFGRSLLEYVSPPFPPTRLLRYDGNHPGDEVHVQLDFILFRQVWKSRIVAREQDDNLYAFTDEATQLPFFLTYWRHNHRVERTGTGCRIVDDFTFRAPLGPAGWLLYPLMYAQFWLRKPLYRRFFQKTTLPPAVP